MLAELALPLTAAGSGAAWASLAARRAGHRGPEFTFRSLLGGAAAFGLALCAYDLLALAGLGIRWELLVRTGAASFLAAAGIGLVEESAKLAGILLVLEQAPRRRTIAAVAAGVAAGFAALEALLVLGGERSVVALARAALGPVAHGLLAVPLALGAAAWARDAGRRVLPLAAALVASAALHGAADLSLATPAIGRLGYAVALGAPVVFLVARKLKGPLGWRTLRTHRE